MIFILSEETDPSTNNVIKWLRYYDKNCIRVNDIDTIELDKCSIGSKNQAFKLVITTKNGGETIHVSEDEISAYWYRRGNLFLLDSKNNKVRLPEITEFIQRQIRDVESYLLYKLASKKSINKLTDVFINKIIAIDVAASVGLKIPSTTITKSRDYIIDDLLTKTPLITKGFKEGVIDFGSYILSGPTIKLENEILDKHKVFNFSLLQDCIDKFADIRIFYLNSSFYAMAIFSQNDESTSIDFRNYNEERPNRNVPFKLPKAILTKLKKLVEKLNINSGSIDMVLDKKNQFYFLELNPVGQFEMTSKPCNYFISKEIAKELIYERANKDRIN